ncbi:MAG: hypothetical protein ACLQIB_10555 [Isosphaeraceae bacterium]
MTDITSKMSAALSLARGWTRERVRHTLSALAELYPDGTVDWEEGDEDWGRVVSRGAATAYVSARCPVAFVEADDETAAQRVLTQLGLVAIVIQDFDAPTVSVDSSVLSQLTSRPLTKNVSYNRASVNELWWATV